MLRAHPDHAALAQRIVRLTDRLVPFRGTVYRSATPQYATTEGLLSGAGAAMVGGRWNPPGIRTVYASLTTETALAETLAHVRYYGLPEAKALPRTFVAIKVRLAAVLDLHQGDVRNRLKMSMDRMIGEDWRVANDKHNRHALTQALGKVIYEAGIEAFIAPSATPGNGANLIVFPQRLRSSSRVEIEHPDKL